MIKGAIFTIQSKAYDFPQILRTIPQPLGQLYVISHNWPGLLERPAVAIVGSRKVTGYGKAVTTQLAGELARAGAVIVSGLALGVDGLAHRAALQASGLTIAVLAGGLDAIYPSSHYQLASHIVEQGGALVSEYSVGIPSFKHQFVERNRIVAGLSQATIVTEAAERSGSLHTAAFALEQGREVFAVPGNITSPQSAGTNQLLKTGAAPVTSAADVLLALGLRATPQAPVRAPTPEAQRIVDLLAAGEQESSNLLRQSKLPVSVFNQALTLLEIYGQIRSLGANRWSLGSPPSAAARTPDP